MRQEEMDERLQKVEKLREKTRVSYTDAHDALVASNWNLLDAILLLERQGKIRDEQAEGFQKQEGSSQAEPGSESQTEYSGRATYSTKKEDKDKTDAHADKKQHENYWDSMVRNFKTSDKSYFTISRKEQELIRVPLGIMLLILIALIIFWPHLTGFVVLVLISFIFGFRYRIEGSKYDSSFNHFSDKVGDKTEAWTKQNMGCGNHKKEERTSTGWHEAEDSRDKD